MGGDPIDLGQPLLASSLKEGLERLLVEPGGRFGKGGHRRKLARRIAGREVAEEARLPETRRPTLSDLVGKQPLMDHLAQAIHDPGPVEVEPRRLFVFERMKGGTLAENVERLRVGVSPDRLEERVARRDPFEAIRLRRLAVGRATRIAVRQGR